MVIVPLRGGPELADTEKSTDPLCRSTNVTEMKEAWEVAIQEQSVAVTKNVPAPPPIGKAKLVGEALRVEQSRLATKLADDVGGATLLDHNTAAARASKIITIRVTDVNLISFLPPNGCGSLSCQGR